MRAIICGMKIFSRDITKNLFNFLLSLLVISLSTLFLSWFLIMRKNLSFFLGKMGEGMRARVFLKEDIGQDEIKDIIRRIGLIPEISWTKLITKEDAAKEFKELFPSFSKALEYDNPFPPNIVVKFKEEKGEGKIRKAIGKIRSIQGVSDIIYQKEVVEKLNRIIFIGKSVGVFLGGLLLLASLLIIANLVGLNISSRKEDIYILNLLGASKGFVSYPFIIQGALLGLLGAGFGILFFKLSFLALKLHPQKIWGNLSFILPVTNLDHREELILFALSGAIGFIAALISVRRYSIEI